jgi:tetratricopeptide (TPR) repeat protein
LITTLDPRPEFFWINGARMISYDVPRWRIREAGGYDAISAHRERAIIEEQAEQAFTFLEKARAFHPENYRLVMEVAQIYLNRLKDDAKAAEWFLKASRLPDCPYYVSRMYAELLRKQGKLNEAYTYLTGLYQSLPNDDPYALKNVVLERIHELEAELSIPVWERFMPSGAGIL